MDAKSEHLCDSSTNPGAPQTARACPLASCEPAQEALCRQVPHEDGGHDTLRVLCERRNKRRGMSTDTKVLEPRWPPWPGAAPGRTRLSDIYLTILAVGRNLLGTHCIESVWLGAKGRVG